jgi:hypothetical protein
LLANFWNVTLGRPIKPLDLYQSIDVRVAMPIFPAPGPQQPDPARQIAQRLGQPLLQFFQPMFLTLVA